MLGTATKGCEASPVGLEGHVMLLQWSVGLQQRRRRTLFPLNAEVAAPYPQVSYAIPGVRVCVYAENFWVAGRRESAL